MGVLFQCDCGQHSRGHANLLTTALAASQWEVVSTAVIQPADAGGRMRQFVMEAGPDGDQPEILPGAARIAACRHESFVPSLENAANIYSENQQRGQPGDVITVSGVDGWE